MHLLRGTVLLSALSLAIGCGSDPAAGFDQSCTDAGDCKAISNTCCLPDDDNQCIAVNIGEPGPECSIVAYGCESSCEMVTSNDFMELVCNDGKCDLEN